MTGWRTRSAILDGSDPLRLIAALLAAEVDVVLVGAGDPPGPDERQHVEELAAVVTGAVARRPELTVMLGGAMFDHLGPIEAAGGRERLGESLLGPAASAGDPPRSALRELLDDVRGGPNDPRRAAGRGGGARAAVLDRRPQRHDIG